MPDLTLKDSIPDDTTAEIRRQLVLAINEHPRSRQMLEAEFGPVWDIAHLTQEFEVLGFRAPFVVVRRHGDRRLGSLLFQHEPRFYFAFVPD